MKLNGWQRLWVVVSVVWILYLVVAGVADGIDSEQVLPVLMALFLVPAFLYAIGAAVAWIRRGFTGG
jgi:hypothetical protein